MSRNDKVQSPGLKSQKYYKKMGNGEREKEGRMDFFSFLFSFAIAIFSSWHENKIRTQI